MLYTKKELKALLKDELKSAKDYKQHGLKSLAKDESKHAFFIGQRLKRMEAKK